MSIDEGRVCVEEGRVGVRRRGWVLGGEGGC